MSASHDPHAQLPPKVQALIDAAVARYEAKQELPWGCKAARDARNNEDAAVAEYLKERP